MVSRSVAFKIALMIKLVHEPCTRIPLGADKQANSIPFNVTPELEIDGLLSENFYMHVQMLNLLNYSCKRNGQ